MRESDILHQLKKEHPDLTEEHIKLILKHYHEGLRYYISRPEEAKGGILINGLMTLKVSTEKVRKFLNKLESGDFSGFVYQDRRPSKHNLEYNINYYKNLLNSLEQHETKTSKSDNDE